MKQKVFFSIIIPVKIINAYIKESIPYILKQEYSDFEILILPNQHTNLESYLKHPKIKVIDTGKVSPAIKRDIGSQKAKGNVLAFLDDDAYPASNWLLKAAEKFSAGERSIGGPAITPPHNSRLQKASSYVFESFLGGGNLSYRYRPWKNEFYVDDYPTVNFMVEKKIFDEIGGFDSSFWPGEDTKFCLDLLHKDIKVLYMPELIVYHHRRSLFFPHIKQIWNYANHRGFFVKKYTETSLRLYYFLPTIFTIAVLLGWLSKLLHPLFFNIWAGSIIFIFLFNFTEILLRSKDILISLFSTTGMFITHISYGIGFIRGILKKDLISKLR